MRDGGNAVDAAIAANAVLCVVYPHMTSVGGGGSGELATIDAVRSRGHETMPERGILTVTVPGTVDTWGRLLERFGTLGLGAVLEPAAALARDGFVITPQLADFLKAAAELLGKESAAQKLYPPMEPGMVLRNPDLATVLSDIGRGGISGFYRGELAAAIVGAISRRDGVVTARELGAHLSHWGRPIGSGKRDPTGYELPPPTQGLSALAMNAKPPPL